MQFGALLKGKEEKKKINYGTRWRGRQYVIAACMGVMVTQPLARTFHSKAKRRFDVGKLFEKDEGVTRP